jgi:hypothetical protein
VLVPKYGTSDASHVRIRFSAIATTCAGAEIGGTYGATFGPVGAAVGGIAGGLIAGLF